MPRCLFDLLFIILVLFLLSLLLYCQYYQFAVAIVFTDSVM